MKDFIACMVHGDESCKATVRRHLPYWTQHKAPILFFSPADKALRVEGHQALAWGKASHHGPGSIERFKYLLHHLQHRKESSEADRIILHEYDSICISQKFPETDPTKVSANAFFNRDQDKRFVEKMYCHPPLAIPMSLLPAINAAFKAMPNDAGGGFWDRAFGEACDRAGIEIVSFAEHTGQGFSKNTIEPSSQLDMILVTGSAKCGVECFHGVKSKEVLDAIIDVSPWILHSTGPKRKYISFACWGESDKYWTGLYRNIELAAKYYPGWTVRVYVPPNIPAHRLMPIRGVGSEPSLASVKYIPDGIQLMMSRFLCHDSPDCERFIVRDADSRIGAREVAAVNEWITHGHLLNVQRDHLCHNNAIPGGLWGGVGGRLVKSMEAAIRSYQHNHANSYGGVDHDQDFLARVVYPAAKNSMMQHDAFYRHVWPGSKDFPTKRVPGEVPRFVGEVFDENEVARESDWDIIKDVAYA